MTRRVLLSWSSGKDSAWALHRLVREDDVAVVGLLTTFNESADRVAMHAVRRELVEAQAAATRVPLWPVLLPWPCSNAEYESRMDAALARAMIAGGLRAVLTCVDPRQLPGAYAGRLFDDELLATLPSGVDPCGERGEFHTFCFAGPMFTSPIAVEVGERSLRDGFCFADVRPATT